MYVLENACVSSSQTYHSVGHTNNKLGSKHKYTVTLRSAWPLPLQDFIPVAVALVGLCTSTPGAHSCSFMRPEFRGEELPDRPWIVLTYHASAKGRRGADRPHPARHRTWPPRSGYAERGTLALQTKSEGTRVDGGRSSLPPVPSGPPN